MDRTRIARRLGGAAARRRRHRRVALLAGIAVVVAVVLILVGGDDDGDGGPPPDEVATGPEQAPEGGDAPTTVDGVCRASNREIGTAQRALLTDNMTEEAIVGFLADAFVDLTRDRSAAIRALDPGPEVLAIVDEHDAVVDAIEADPASAAGLENPFAAVNDRWRAAGFDDCVIDATTVPS